MCAHVSVLNGHARQCLCVRAGVRVSERNKARTVCELFCVTESARALDGKGMRAACSLVSIYRVLIHTIGQAICALTSASRAEVAGRMDDMALTCTMQPAGVVHGIMKALLKIKMGRTRAREGERASTSKGPEQASENKETRVRRDPVTLPTSLQSMNSLPRSAVPYAVCAYAFASASKGAESRYDTHSHRSNVSQSVVRASPPRECGGGCHHSNLDPRHCRPLLMSVLSATSSALVLETMSWDSSLFGLGYSVLKFLVG